VVLDAVLVRIRFCHLYFEVKLSGYSAIGFSAGIRFTMFPAGCRNEGEWLTMTIVSLSLQPCCPYK